MSKKEVLHYYEIVNRSDTEKIVMLRTCSLDELKKGYRRYRAMPGMYFRVYVDGQELTAAEAAALCHVGAKGISILLHNRPMETPQTKEDAK